MSPVRIISIQPASLPLSSCRPEPGVGFSPPPNTRLKLPAPVPIGSRLRSHVRCSRIPFVSFLVRRERVCWLVLRAASIYVAGGLLAWSSFALTGDAAQIALWGGLLLNNAGPLAFGYDFWIREQGSW